MVVEPNVRNHQKIQKPTSQDPRSGKLDDRSAQYLKLICLLDQTVDFCKVVRALLLS